MQEANKWDVLANAPLADEAACIEHFTSFVNSFVEKSRRGRWLNLLLNRPKQIYRNSHKLHSHLNWSKCSLLINESLLNQENTGVYYDFTNDPIVLSVADAFIVGTGTDGIFSITPGKLAVYFFHENENVICKT